MASAPLYKAYGIDGMPLTGNCAATITSAFNTQNGTTYDSSGNPNGQQVAYVQVIRSAVGSGASSLSSGYLDVTAWEGGPTSFGVGSTSTPDAPGGLSQWHPGGANVIWLPDGSLAAIYRTRTGSGAGWQHWWRINRMGGEQQMNYNRSGAQGTYNTLSPDGSFYIYQPPVSSGVMGNWSARQEVLIATSHWCQVAHGQDRVVALYNPGTLTCSDRRVVLAYNSYLNYLEDPRQTYSRGLDNLYIIFALDGECKTWSDPVLVASMASPLVGGICWTGGEWVCCYMDSAGHGVCKRSASLEDWSGAVTTYTNVVRPADTSSASYPYLTPAKELFCYGLAYDAQRDVINGLWGGYDDTPQQYYSGANNPAGNPIHNTIWYGWYDSVVSLDQGRTWTLALPSARSTSVGMANDGGACVVNETAMVRDPLYNGKLLHSHSGFMLSPNFLIG